ncbi:Lanosterol synthase (Oxidosqualene--lanosterol cyclase) [Clarireedia jacksonii]
MSLAVPSTDLNRWRLKSNEGVHEWIYLSVEAATSQRQSFVEQFLLGLNPTSPILPSAQTFTGSAINGLRFYQQLQLPEGHWAADYGGPSFLIPGLVFALYISKSRFPDEWKIEMTRYIANIQNKDGGWGLHAEDNSTVFATSMYYIVLRILGMEKTHGVAMRARDKLLALGGAIGAPQWGKYWLSTLNLYQWEGVNPVPPELW